MSEYASRPEIVASIEFTADQVILSLAELKEYIQTRGTAEPISAAALFKARIITLEEIDEGDFPDDNEFTPAEASYLSAVIDYCEEHPKRAEELINLEHFEGVTDIEIYFPSTLEPPAELR